MSKDFKFHSATVGTDGLQAGFDLDTGEGYYTQDISYFKEKAKRDRELQDTVGVKKDGYRKMATIPDVLAIKIP